MKADLSVLGKTRAEEHDEDVWGSFFIPPYYTKIALKNATKSTYLVGRRGSGKTMLLKYMDYHSAFSRKRSAIPPSEIEHIGIYWRIDTHFCSAMHRRGVSEHDWTLIFQNYFALIVSIEICSSLLFIANSSFVGINFDDVQDIDLAALKDFDENIPGNIKEIHDYFSSVRRRFNSWVSNIRSPDVKTPLLPAGKDFLVEFIDLIKKSEKMRAMNFFIYVDEIENLVTYQRKVMNTYLKHSQRPLIVNFTSKVMSDENLTLCDESINATHDYNLKVIEELMDHKETKLFFAEVFLGNLEIANRVPESVIVQNLTDESFIVERRDEAYRTMIMSKINQKFPSMELKKIAKKAFEDQRLQRVFLGKLEASILSKNLNKSDTSLEIERILFYKDYPEALLVCPVLLSRKNNSIDYIVDQLNRYSLGIENDFSRGAGWIHNNLFACLLELYRPYGQPCPLYSGFETFCTMSGNNLRHFIILCYRSMEVASVNDECADADSVSMLSQSMASYYASDELIKEIKTFGELGERLRVFVLRLGSIFKHLQSIQTLSEPEQNSFTINAGGRTLHDSEVKFISEARKYGILIESYETKNKGSIGKDIVDYQLNPIYAPYFGISYRKKRKIELTVEQFETLVSGAIDSFASILTSFTKVKSTDQLGFDYE